MADEIDLSAFPDSVRETYNMIRSKVKGVPTFGTEQGNGFHGVPFSKSLEQADIAVLGCAYDLGTSFRSGARFGPRLGGYTLITADNFLAAQELAQRCPILREGGGVEIGELVPVQGREHPGRVF